MMFFPDRFGLTFFNCSWLVALLVVQTAKVAAVCPTSFSVDCISWSEEGGQCQALHAIVRLRDDLGNPVNGALVEVDPNIKVTGKKKNIRETTSSLSTNYQGEVDTMCPADSLPYEGTTAAFCWQKGIVGAVYEIIVIDIVWPDCPSAVWIPGPNDVGTYTFTGQLCS